MLQVGAAHLRDAERLMASEAAAVAGLAVKNGRPAGGDLRLAAAVPSAATPAPRRARPPRSGPTPARRDGALGQPATGRGGARPGARGGRHLEAGYHPASRPSGRGQPGRWLGRPRCRGLAGSAAARRGEPACRRWTVRLRHAATRVRPRQPDDVRAARSPAGEGGAWRRLPPSTSSPSREPDARLRLIDPRSTAGTAATGGPPHRSRAGPPCAWPMPTVLAKVPVSEGTRAARCCSRTPSSSGSRCSSSRRPAFRAVAALSGIEGPVAILSVPTVRPSAIGAFQWMSAHRPHRAGLGRAALGLARSRSCPPTCRASWPPRPTGSPGATSTHGSRAFRRLRHAGRRRSTRASEVAGLARIAQGATGRPAPGRSPPARPPAAAPAPSDLPAPTLDVPLHAVPPEETTGRTAPATPGAPGCAAPRPRSRPLDGRRPARSPPPRRSPQRRPRAPPIPAPPSPSAWTDLTRLRATHAPPGRRGGPGAASTRSSCGSAAQGETVDGLTWDRFRAKLEKNSSCWREARLPDRPLQVYVKDGKAALRATPVK